MKKVYQLFTCLALTGLVFIQTSLKAQSQSKVLCGDEFYRNSLETKYPGFKNAVNNTFNECKNNKTNYRNATDYTVNVVVHVVWKDAAENLADSIIQSQIDVLNEDFNRLNADSSNLRSIFNPIAGNAHIHLNLAQVVRKQTTQTFGIDIFGGGGMPNEMKWDSLGGSTAVDPDHYLNIWVVKIQSSFIGQILGFAFPPAGLSNWPAGQSAPVKGEDGVVIDFRCFGRNNPNPIDPTGQGALDIRGRTVTHEVSHYFGLRHIWGDGGSPFGGGNNCTGNDGIDDTPKATEGSQFDCDTTKNTCIDTLAWTSADAPDLIENYMDYSTETCMNMHTKGQVEHMHAVLDGPRNGLLQPSGINLLALDKNTKLFPNPAKDQLTITTLGNIINKVELVDVLGKTTLTINPAIATNEIKIDLSAINTGTYFVKSYTNVGTTNIKKVLVVK